MEDEVKKMLEAWVSRNNCCWISSYNYIENESEGNYTISIMETDKEDNIYLSKYHISISDSELRISEIS